MEGEFLREKKREKRVICKGEKESEGEIFEGKKNGGRNVSQAFFLSLILDFSLFLSSLFPLFLYLFLSFLLERKQEKNL